MKKLALFAVVLFLVVAASADACLGQRASRRADRRASRPMSACSSTQTTTTRSTTTIRMNAPTIRFQMVPMQMGSGCANGQCAPGR